MSENASTQKTLKCVEPPCAAPGMCELAKACAMTIPSKATLPMTNRLFARRAAYMASSAAKWAADSLDLELDEPVSQDYVRRLAEEMRGWIARMERDYAER